MHCMSVCLQFNFLAGSLLNLGVSHHLEVNGNWGGGRLQTSCTGLVHILIPIVPAFAGTIFTPLYVLSYWLIWHKCLEAYRVMNCLLCVIVIRNCRLWHLWTGILARRFIIKVSYFRYTCTCDPNIFTNILS